MRSPLSAVAGEEFCGVGSEFDCSAPERANEAAAAVLRVPVTNDRRESSFVIASPGTGKGYTVYFFLGQRPPSFLERFITEWKPDSREGRSSKSFKTNHLHDRTDG